MAYTVNCIQGRSRAKCIDVADTCGVMGVGLHSDYTCLHTYGPQINAVKYWYGNDDFTCDVVLHMIFYYIPRQYIALNRHGDLLTRCKFITRRMSTML